MGGAFAAAARAANPFSAAAKSPLSTTEKVTPLNDVTSYNNFYEFGTEQGRARPETRKL